MKKQISTEANEGNEATMFESPHVVSYIVNRKSYIVNLLAILLTMICAMDSPAYGQSIIDFYLAQFTGNTNDTTINIQAKNNPIIYNGQFYWWPQYGSNILTTNGLATITLVPGHYTVSIAAVSTAWNITVTNSATPLNAANLSTQITIYNGINSLSGAGVTTDGHGNYTVIGIGSATNFTSGQNTTWTNIGGNNQVNLTGTLTNNTTGSAATANVVTGVQSNQPPEVQAIKPDLWMDASQVIATNNGQPFSVVPDESGNGWTLFSGTTTPPLWLDGGHSPFGRPCFSFLANWNPVTGASPTISYALTNTLQFGNTNYCLTIVYWDALQLGGSGTTPELNGGVSPYLFQDGINGSADLAFAYYSQYFENQCGINYNQNASVAQIAALPLHFKPVVVTFRLQNGYQDEFINGVQVTYTNLSSHSLGTSTGNEFILGNVAFGGVISPGNGAFCGDIAEVLINASNAPSTSAILNLHDELMRKYKIGGGSRINFVGDSITFGTLGLYPYNLTSLTESAFPGAFVDNEGLSGEASPNIYTCISQSVGNKPYGTTITIDTDMYGVNDNLEDLTLAGWETNVINTANLQHLQGHVVNWCTLPSFNGESNVPTRASMNAFLYANTNLFDALVTYDQDKLMGTNGSCAVNPTLYNMVYAPIGVHWLPPGYQELFTNWLFPVLQRELSGGGAVTGGSYTGGFSGGGTNLSLGYTTTNGVSISMIQSLPIGQTIRVICPTNVPGSTNGANTVITNTCASFYLSGTPTSPGIYEIRGQVGGQCTNSTDGFYVSLGSYLGTDFGEGWYGYQPNQSYFSAGFNSSRLAFCDSFNVTNNIGIFDFRTTTVQTNQYNWQVYQVVNSPLDIPFLNTNTFFTITKWQ
jgi:hypothetical protein